MRRSLLAGLLAMGMGTVGLSPAYANGATTFVDDDGAAGPNNCDEATATFATIQSAVDAATPGDTVLVCPGTYTEQLVIAKSLTLQGVSAATVTLEAPAVLATETDGDGASIVEITGSGNQVDLLSFTIRGPLSGLQGAVHAHDGASAWIGMNVIEGTDALTGTILGAGITVGSSLGDDDAAAGLSSVTDNAVSGFHRAGIVVAGPGNSVTITGNTVTGAGPTSDTIQSGITVQDSAAGVVSHNTVSNLGYTGPAPSSAVGVFLWDAANGASISWNTIDDAQTGMMVQAVENLTVSWNTVTVGAAFDAALNPANPAMGMWLLGRGSTGLWCADGDGSTPGLGCATGGNFAWNDFVGAGTGTGVRIGGTAALGWTPAPTSGAVTDGDITAWDVGIAVGAASPENSIAFWHNWIGLNDLGAENGTGYLLDARKNWWASASGPGGWGTGTGDPVSANVDFFPWYTDVGTTTLRTCDLTAVRGRVLVGTDASEVLCGTWGKDTIRGRGGNDLILGGGGADLLYGQGGDDALIGHGGKDGLFGGKGFDSLQGRAGKDVCEVGGGGGQTATCE
ncbi:MAG: right-handed parallel beta-helix repeat-containing protein [Actinobacteria bacterium]|nr:right-handed parallel beta-helix repeat-containing protein [Actinomycetota bacterium]